MSQSDNIDNIAKQLGALISPKQLPPKDPHEEAAEHILEHARCNTYVGPPTGGPMYSGWPLTELDKMIPNGFRPQVRLAMMNKMGQQGIRHSDPTHMHRGVGSSVSNRPHSLEEMMAMRMRWGQGVNRLEGFTHMAMICVNDVVHIWIVTKDGQSLVLQDEHGLFPSDALITKIRLLQRGE
jgi:hypothetical protein